MIECIFIYKIKIEKHNHTKTYIIYNNHSKSQPDIIFCVYKKIFIKRTK